MGYASGLWNWFRLRCWLRACPCRLNYPNEPNGWHGWHCVDCGAVPGKGWMVNGDRQSYGVLLYFNGRPYCPFAHGLRRCVERSAENWRRDIPNAHAVPMHRMPLHVGTARDLRIAMGKT